MMDSGADDRRGFFRVSETLRIESRPISVAEASVLEVSLTTDPSLSDTSSPPFCRPTPLNEDICGYLQNIDRKLNLIVDMLSGNYSALENRLVRADISGSGIRYESDAPMDVDTFLDLRIGIWSSPGGDVRALGKVLRSQLTDEKAESPWEIAVRFVAISERDRDALVCYVFSRERQQLQAMKEPTTSD
jgi:hypothetical protein